MNPLHLLDAASALIVVGGTGLATVLRCGASGISAASGALVQLTRAGFDADATRAEMARQMREIQQDGLLRAHAHHFGDREFDSATEAMIAHRSVPALLAAHEAHRAMRQQASARAVGTLAQGAELAPVFGLAGTLVSLSQLPAAGIAQGSFASAISMAVLTTLYGLLLANLVLAPLARLVERASAREEGERQQIIDWLASHVERSEPQRVPSRPDSRPSGHSRASEAA